MAETELDRFFRENRLREAQSVNPSVFADPRYASMIYNSSVPLNQLEKNIQQSQGYMLEPAYNPTMRDTSQKYTQSALDYLKSKGIVGKDVLEGKKTLKDVTESFTGTEDSIGLVDATPIGSLFAAQEGQRALVKAEPDAFKRSMATLSFMRNPFQTYLDRPEVAKPLFEMASGAVEGLGFAYLARPVAKQFKNFAKSLSDKIKGEGGVSAPPIGALPLKTEPKMLASTRRMPPGGGNVMTDPKVVDEYGFYSEAERQAKIMQQNKGSGAQFAGFLLNKGVKQDELDAIGLTDLFENNNNVTKKDIIDTIELNKVALIETKKSRQLDDGIDAEEYFATETFTDIRKGNEGFKSADEVKEAYETGNYSRPTIEYDAKVLLGLDVEPKSMKLYGTINTHVPTQYKTVVFENLDDTEQDVTDIYFTFRPDADVKDWRNSVEAEEYVDEINNRIRTEGSADGQTELAETKNLVLDDLAEIIEMHTARSFDEAVVRLKSATIQDGVYDPGSVARWEGNTQKGGTNYKEYLLRLPPKGENRFGKMQLDNPKVYDKNKDFQYKTHFDEFNPIFHIRTKDRISSDGRKILYVEELQSDWGQRGAGRGFKLEGSKLKQAEKELKDVRKQLLDLKKGGVQLDGYEQETLYKFAFPDRPPIRIPYKKPKDFQAQHENPAKYYDTNANVKDYDFDYSQSRMPEEFRTMTFGQYMNFYDTMGEYRKGELSDQSLKYRLEGIIDKDNSINKYYDDKDADFLFGQINQPRFNADGNKFMKELSKNYLKKLNQVQGGVPSAPFVTDRNKWTGLAIKRLLKLADEGGYDAIAFTPGEVQYDRWGKLSLVDYYNKIIPQVASKLPKSLGVTTEKIKIPIPSDKSLSIAEMSDGRFYVYDSGDQPVEQFFDESFRTREEAREFIKQTLDMTEKGQETFAINVTPKMKETVRGGMPLFSATGGAIGLGATMNNEDYGALSNMPSTQANAT